ncbi:hypothetical protein SAMN05660297_02437 [Natronincola peptidivorans]|uniref:Uncharacterized protein n=1 Tax=Natronincola peptidivorans TaxID=426128 RepID=A0A1I0EK12_9FIRM|nr:hypothetical protein [Natronincola peptidivorans]SET45286.1 hypothetical protein SAMN05660297_02437 [Natronincola peptidivorans]
MQVMKRDWWKIIGIIFISGFINMVLHAWLTPDDISNLSDMKFSYFVENGMVFPAIIIWELLAYSVFALVFILIQDSLQGQRWKKGLLYGLSFGGLYFIGMFEAVLLLNTSVLSEFIMGLTDATAFIISGVLLGVFIGTDSVQKYKKKNPLAILIIGLFYLVGRYFAYTVVNVQSAYNTNPWPTLIWTLSLGLWIGSIYYMLETGIKGRTSIWQAVFFGSIIYGSNWLLNHIFMYIIIEFTFDLLIRLGIDIVFIIIGVYAYKKLFNRSLNVEESA